MYQNVSEDNFAVVIPSMEPVKKSEESEKVLPNLILNGPYANLLKNLKPIPIPRSGFPCDQCGQRLTTKFNLKRHIQIKHKTQPLPFSAPTVIKDPVLTVDIIPPQQNLLLAPADSTTTKTIPAEMVLAKCDDCDSLFTDGNELERHRRESHEKNFHANELIRQWEEEEEETIMLETSEDISGGSTTSNCDTEHGNAKEENSIESNCQVRTSWTCLWF